MGGLLHAVGRGRVRLVAYRRRNGGGWSPCLRWARFFTQRTAMPLVSEDARRCFANVRAIGGLSQAPCLKRARNPAHRTLSRGMGSPCARKAANRMQRSTSPGPSVPCGKAHDKKVRKSAR